MFATVPDMNGHIEISAQQSYLQWRNNTRRGSLGVQTVDLLIDDDRSSATLVSGFEHDSASPPFFSRQSQSAISGFIQRARKATNDATRLGIKIILPASDGYVSRSDMVELRFFGCELVKLASSFVAPRQHVLAFNAKEQSVTNRLHSILDSAIGAILVDPKAHVEHALEELELEMTNRLSIQWLLPEPIPYKRVAIVGCLPENLSYETIKAMGIGLVVLDKPGHYFEDPAGPLAHLREAFCPIDLNPDAGLTQRIVDALQGQKVDGLHTRFDIFHMKVAQAAGLLGLPASPPSAFAIATNKYGARMLEADHNSALCVTDAEELQQRLPYLKIEYPVVVKPCTGRTSWGVVKVDNEADMIAAVTKARSRVIGYDAGKPVHSLIMIEPYIDGPEIDVNLALWDGEVLFADVSDNFPCAGDLAGGIDFQETMFAHPSILPQAEQELAIASLRDSVVRMGFRAGLFHTEARIRNSSMSYVYRSGVIELEPKASPPKAKPSVFMIEVNPRPAGYYDLQALTWTYGVDYYAMHVLRCIEDERRYKAFAAPFQNGPQHSSALVLIMPEKGGILTSPDPVIEMKPDLTDCIPLYHNIFSQGQYVTPPDAVDMTYMAVVVINTRKGRKDLLKKAEEVRKEWHVTIE